MTKGIYKHKKGKLSNVFGKHWKLSEKTKAKMKGNKNGKGLKGYKQLQKHIKKRIRKSGWKQTEEAVKKISGKNHYNWKGGITSEEMKIRHSLEYIIWQQEVYKKDCSTCRLCGSKKDIIAHHLKLFSEFPELRFSVDNGIVLCRSCHAKIHHILKDKEL